MIVVIEDNKILLDCMVEDLNELGYPHVKAYQNPREFMYEDFNKIKKKICLAILDCNLPVISGTEIAERIKKECKAPVIMISAYDREENLSVDRWLVKPWDKEYLFKNIVSVQPLCRQGRDSFLGKLFCFIFRRGIMRDITNVVFKSCRREYC